MSIALLFLGLIPLVFLPDMLNSGDDDSTDDMQQIPEPITGQGDDMLDGNWEDANNLPPNGVETISDVEPDPDDILSPVDEDDVATPADDDDDDNVLSPVDGDDSPTDGTPDPDDILSPVDENDIDTHAAMAPQYVEDFQVGKDILRVSVDHSALDTAPVVDLQATEDGQDCQVFVSNMLVAVIKNAPDVMVRDVKIVVEHPRN